MVSAFVIVPRSRVKRGGGFLKAYHGGEGGGEKKEIGSWCTSRRSIKAKG